MLQLCLEHGGKHNGNDKSKLNWGECGPGLKTRGKWSLCQGLEEEVFTRHHGPHSHQEGHSHVGCGKEFLHHLPTENAEKDKQECR